MLAQHIGGVLAGIVAALFVVRRTVRPLKSIAKSIRALAGGEKRTSIPATDVDNEIGDIARATLGSITVATMLNLARRRPENRRLSARAHG